ncbi:hypothetical protein DEO72_LG10g2834 [Vigna unguiculata]|uniref:Uncharacterized protein n=1 Tax=Vigna unguiculata TaxID=3917 RepID=A0A4D6NFA0_VIGUN|nr:hypothetical protein DEO72_LG10g2834 [Vigna unguiculata]
MARWHFCNSCQLFCLGSLNNQSRIYFSASVALSTTVIVQPPFTSSAILEPPSTSSLLPRCCGHLGSIVAAGLSHAATAPAFVVPPFHAISNSLFSPNKASPLFVSLSRHRCSCFGKPPSRSAMFSLRVVNVSIVASSQFHSLCFSRSQLSTTVIVQPPFTSSAILEPPSTSSLLPRCCGHLGSIVAAGLSHAATAPAFVVPPFHAISNSLFSPNKASPLFVSLSRHRCSCFGKPPSRSAMFSLRVVVS